MVSGGGKLSVVATIMSLRIVGSVQNNCLNMVRTATITSGNNTLCKRTYGKLDRIQDAFSSKHAVIKLTCAFRKKKKTNEETNLNSKAVINHRVAYNNR